jgi:hypothetical protein
MRRIRLFQQSCFSNLNDLRGFLYGPAQFFAFFGDNKLSLACASGSYYSTAGRVVTDFEFDAVEWYEILYSLCPRGLPPSLLRAAVLRYYLCSFCCVDSKTSNFALEYTVSYFREAFGSYAFDIVYCQ